MSFYPLTVRRFISIFDYSMAFNDKIVPGRASTQGSLVLQCPSFTLHSSSTIGEKQMKKSTLLMLTAIAFTAIALTSCASKPAAETAPAQDPQQMLNAALEAAATPADKAEVLAKAAADAVVDLGKKKAEAEATAKAFEAVAGKPAMIQKLPKEKNDKAQAALSAAEAFLQSVQDQAKAAAVAAAAAVATDIAPAEAAGLIEKAAEAAAE
jgi:hypothetical protein